MFQSSLSGVSGTAARRQRPNCAGRVRPPTPSNAHPQLQIEVLARKGLPDFVGESLDTAMFIGELPDREIVARLLGRSPFTTCAAPAYLARYRQPRSSEDLAEHDVIGIRSSDQGAALDWRFQIDGRDVQMPLACRAAFEASEPAVKMAASGGGIPQMIHYLLAPDLASGRLVPLLEDIRYTGADISFVYPRHTRRPRRLRLLEEFITASCLDALSLQH